MKRALVVIAITVGIAVLARDQAPPFPRNEAGDITYQEVVQVDGASSAELCARARAWVANSYRSAKDVIQMDDPVSGKIIARGYYQVAFLGDMHFVRHDITIELKDGRYRATITDLVMEIAPSQYGPGGKYPIQNYIKKDGTPQMGAAKMLQRVHAASLATLEDLNAAMNKPSPAKSTEW